MFVHILKIVNYFMRRLLNPLYARLLPTSLKEALDGGTFPWPAAKLSRYRFRYRFSATVFAKSESRQRLGG